MLGARTRSKQAAATKDMAHPASRTRARQSHLQQPTPTTHTNKHTGPAAAVEQQCNRKILRHLTTRTKCIENEVHQAMAVINTESGKLLNYRQLMRDPQYKKQWSISSANEFGRLANGVGGRIKGTNTIKFVHKHNVPHKRMKDVIYGQFVCSVRAKIFLILK